MLQEVGGERSFMCLDLRGKKCSNLALMHRTTVSERLGRLHLVVALGTLLQGVTIAHAEPKDANQADLINPDRPGIADGSNVVGAGRFQVETGTQLEYRKDAASREQTIFAPTLLRYGINDSWEARVESNVYNWKRSIDPVDGVVIREGAAPTSFGVKYHFIDGAGIKRPSVGAILRVFPPSGTRSFRNTATTGDFRLAADWDFAPQWSLNPNIGIARMEGTDMRTYTAGLFAATLNYNPTKRLNFFVDFGGQTPEEKRGRTSLIVDLGVAYIIGENVELDLTIGFGAAGVTPPRRFLSLGVSKRL